MIIAMHTTYRKSFKKAGIYILAIPQGEIFVQIEKQGKNLKEDMKKGRKKGEK